MAVTGKDYQILNLLALSLAVTSTCLTFVLFNVQFNTSFAALALGIAILLNLWQLLSVICYIISPISTGLENIYEKSN